ncbi:hypothetical protein ACGFNU_23795 [Spirillospora sp. NPDC048911]|uniref:hypothetical protein n=1 Tax=Spirillospora sp. NPDC048911 TaxID=3364527 RepID=UPI00371662B8
MAGIFRRRGGAETAETREMAAPADGVARSLVEISRLVTLLTRTHESIRAGGPPVVDTITMGEVVGFFVEHRDEAKGAVAAVAVRRPDPRGQLLWLGFVDAAGRPLAKPARAYVANSLDPELDESFGAHQVVLFT